MRGKDDLLLRGELHGNGDDVFVHNTGQRFPLGSRLIDWSLGRKFVYAKNGAATLLPGNLAQSPVPNVNHEDLVIAAAAVGDRTITVTPATDNVTANQYAGGLLMVGVGAAGLGDVYRIKSHPAITAGVAGVFTLSEPIRRPLAAATHQVSLLPGPYRDVVIHGSVPTAKVVGVPLVAAAASEYLWLQTWGPAPALIDGTVVIGQQVMPSNATDGSVEALGLTEGTPNVAITPPVGWVMKVGDTGDHGFIYLTIE
jgi:hypothetical protein